MTGFAANTSVSVEKTRVEIEKLLARHGARQFIAGWDGDTALIGFVLANRQIKFLLRLPDRSEKRFKFTPSGKWALRPDQQVKAWEQACRSHWRALMLVIKAKLEATATGISTVEDEFLAWTVLPGDGRTIGEVLQPQIAASIASGSPARLLLGGGS